MSSYEADRLVPIEQGFSGSADWPPAETPKQDECSAFAVPATSLDGADAALRGPPSGIAEMDSDLRPLGSFQAQRSRQLHLRYHGYPEVQVDGRVVALKLKRGLALLVYLAEVARKSSRAQIAELLWPDAPLDVGRARLRRLCHEVNTLLDLNVFAGDGDAIWLDTTQFDLQSDVLLVRHAATAIDGARICAGVQALFGAHLQSFGQPNSGGLRIRL